MSDLLPRRLLSPQKRRIYPNAKTGTGIKTVGSITRQQRSGLAPGQADDITWNCLVALGWTEYKGPAITDDQGYIIPGTDPMVMPTPWPGPPKPPRGRHENG